MNSVVSDNNFIDINYTYANNDPKKYILICRTELSAYHRVTSRPLANNLQMASIGSCDQWWWRKPTTLNSTKWYFRPILLITSEFTKAYIYFCLSSNSTEIRKTFYFEDFTTRFWFYTIMGFILCRLFNAINSDYFVFQNVLSVDLFLLRGMSRSYRSD